MSLFYELYLVPPTVLIPIIFALINYKLLDKPLKIILLFLIVSGVADAIAVILAINHRPNLMIFHIYAIFEFAFISWYYKLQLKNRLAKIIPLLIIMFTIACIINFVFIQKNIEFNTYTRSLEAIIIIGYNIILFSRQSYIDADYNWSSMSLNWINTGILVYYSSCLLVFTFSNYLLNAGKFINNVIWNTHATITVLQYILFSIGFYKCKKQQIIYTY